MRASTPADAELAARTVVYYVLGFTVDEQSRLQWDAAGAELPDAQSVLTEDPDGAVRFRPAAAGRRNRRAPSNSSRPPVIRDVGRPRGLRHQPIGCSTLALPSQRRRPVIRRLYLGADVGSAPRS